ncbi:N-acetylneuraminate synthase family protein [bacterium]|nr:N-acetylneuraminate synthase family protein [bacterium]
MKELKNFGFNTDNRTYVIAEIGINHGGDINIAKQMIDSVSKTGADAVKFQTYITEKRVSKDSPIFEILKKCELPFEAFKELQSYSKKLNLDFFSTPFDEESVDFLESIDIDLYKIASFDIGNMELLEKVAKTNKTIIMSVGMSNIDEIQNAYNCIKKYNSKIALLHCVSSYPTNEADSNISTIFNLKENFKDCIIGQSDHTNDIDVPGFSVCAGAQILEKHFKVDESMECVDSPVSITETQLKNLVIQTRRIEKIMGSSELQTRECEKGSLVYRRKS